jgi:hypothetical protein
MVESSFARFAIPPRGHDSRTGSMAEGTIELGRFEDIGVHEGGSGRDRKFMSRKFIK